MLERSLIAAIGVVALPAFLLAGEKKIDLADAPAAVQTAVKTALAGNSLEKLSKETEDGKTTYEAEFDVNKADHSVTVSEDGKVIEEETDIELTDLPAGVKSAVLKAEPDGKLKEASKVSADGKNFYEVDVKVKDVKHEIKVDEAGALVSNKIEKDGDGDKD